MWTINANASMRTHWATLRRHYCLWSQGLMELITSVFVDGLPADASVVALVRLCLLVVVSARPVFVAVALVTLYG